MAFNGTEAKQVTLTEASGWTANFRNAVPSGTTLAHFFGKDHINDILNQSGCMGIRVYNGIDDEGEKVLIMVGADANEDDMTNGVIVEKAVKCPSICGVSNPLNS